MANVSNEWLSEDACKTLYKALYIWLNKAVGYFRSAIQLRGGFKAVAKAVAFLYLSIAFKFLGDRLTLYLCNLYSTDNIPHIGILGFFLYTPLSKKFEGNPEEDKKA